jgi:hypothetical protein
MHGLLTQGTHVPHRRHTITLISVRDNSGTHTHTHTHTSRSLTLCDIKVTQRAGRLLVRWLHVALILSVDGSANTGLSVVNCRHHVSSERLLETCIL